MNHISHLDDETRDTIESADGLTTIRTITARLRDRIEPVSTASHDGPQNQHGAVPSPAPATSIPLEVLAKSSKRRSSTQIVSTKRLHNDAGRDDPARSFHWMSEALTPLPAGDRTEQ